MSKTRTADVARAVAVKNLKGSQAARQIAKPSEIISASPEKGRSLSLPAAKAYNLMLCVAQVDGFVDKQYTITKRELRGSHGSNDRIADILKELHSIAFSVRGTLDGKSGTWWLNLLAPTFEQDGDDDTGNVYFRLPLELTAIIKESNQWAILLAKVMQKFTSVYALRLYEIGCIYYRRDDPCLWMTPEELRSSFVVPEGAYQDWANLRRNVLDKAIKEVSELVDEFSVELPEDKIKRSGRKVVKFMLIFNVRETVRKQSVVTTQEVALVQTDLDLTVRALRKIEKDSIAVRQQWWTLAQQRGAAPITAPTAAGNIAKWVGYVAEDILK